MSNEKHMIKLLSGIAAFGGKKWSIACLLVALAGMSAFAQGTAVINPITTQIWGGANSANTLVVASNTVVLSGFASAPSISFSVSGQPSGATVTLGNTNIAANGTFYFSVRVAVTNVAAGTYPLTITASGDAFYSTNVTLSIVPQWAFTNGTGNWSDSGSWLGGQVPGVNDSVYIEHSPGSGPFTNVVDSSRTIQSLVYLGDSDDAGAALAAYTQIAPGVTFSIVGPNGFVIGRKSNTSARPWYFFSGESLVVSNAAASFGLMDAVPNATRWLTVNMTNLNNLNVTVSRVAAADNTLAYQSAFGGQLVAFQMARTNVITALYADDYSAPDFNTSIQFMKELNAVNNGQAGNAYWGLGISNAFFADSIGIGRGRAVGSGSTAFSPTIGYAMKFTPVFSNSVAPIASAYFRNTNGGRMSLLAVGVDSGVPNTIANNRGVLDLRGGVVDVLVDQIWVGRNRTNVASPGFDSLGVLLFDWGKINANSVRLGYMQYTNLATSVAGYLSVGTNGVFYANDFIELGHTPTNDDAVTTWPNVVAATGQIRVDNGGAVRSSKITLGRFSTNNVITINAGGNLDVTNTIASTNKALTSLTVNGALTLHLNGGETPVYTTNFAGNGVINITSLAGLSFPTNISIISYQVDPGTLNISAGTIAGGLSATISKNSGNKTIDLNLTTGSPKVLVWQGYVNGNWDNSTKNWLDLATGLHTNFSAGDYAIFDDTASAASITLAEDVVPAQSPTTPGMIMTNSVLNYVFTGSGRILGSSIFAKYGAQNLAVDSYTEIQFQLKEGHATNTASGSIGSVNTSVGSFFVNQGTILGTLSSAGTAVNYGTINGSLAARTLGVVTNAASGYVGAGISFQDGSFMYNAGILNNIGSATVVSNAVFINEGPMNAGSLAVSGLFEDKGLNGLTLDSLTINGQGTFIPGGDGIGTTRVLNNGLADNNGRVVFLTGSTNIFKVDLNNGQPYTVIQSRRTTFGPNQATLIQNGGTILITNIGSIQFAAGQTFALFQNDFGGAPFDTGLNTTNALSVILPSIPGNGLAWDLGQLIHGGVIGIKAINTNPTNVMFGTSFATTISTNVPPVTNNYIVANLSWPSDYIGWKLQQQQVTLATGLGTNWTTVAASVFTNSMVLTNAYSTNSAVFYRLVYP